jgi:hypothetical protein
LLRRNVPVTTFGSCLASFAPMANPFHEPDSQRLPG